MKAHVPRQGQASAREASAATAVGPLAGARAASADARTVAQRARIEAAFGAAVVQRGSDPDFMFGGQGIKKTKVSTQAELQVEVEQALEDRFGGVENLFEVNSVATSPSDWAALIHSYLEDTCDLQRLGLAQVLLAVRETKDKLRHAQLLQRAQNAFTSDDNIYSAQRLRELMRERGAYLDEGLDGPVIDVLFATEGQFTKAKVEVGHGCVELADSDDIVVIIDSHQNKHHNPPLPQLAPYGGGKGTQFAVDKGLDWHRGTTVPAVRTLVQDAIDAGDVLPDGVVFCTPKDAVDGIIYDLSIQYDSETGKYVGSYHCNPVDSEQ